MTKKIYRLLLLTLIIVPVLMGAYMVDGWAADKKAYENILCDKLAGISEVASEKLSDRASGP